MKFKYIMHFFMWALGAIILSAYWIDPNTTEIAAIKWLASVGGALILGVGSVTIEMIDRV